MVLEKVAEFIAESTLDILRRELASKDDQQVAAARAWILLHQKLLHDDAQAALDARRRVQRTVPDE